MSIHPTAIVGKDVRLGKGVEIGPYCVIEDGVRIGEDTKLWQGVYVASGTTIGRDCQVHMGAVLGHIPQDLAFEGKPTYLKIGDRNIIREYVTIHRGTKEKSATVLGDDNFLMALSHLGHNCELGNKIVICNNSLLAGYVSIGDMAFISGNCVVHQFVRIGKLVIIGGLARIGKDVPPYMVAERESLVTSYNIIGLKRAGFNQELRNQVKKAYQLLYHSGLNINNAAEKIEKEFDSTEIKEFVNFIKSADSKRGICKYQERRQVRI